MGILYLISLYRIISFVVQTLYLIFSCTTSRQDNKTSAYFKDTELKQ
jgi:hypothetical protein